MLCADLNVQWHCMCLMMWWLLVCVLTISKHHVANIGVVKPLYFSNYMIACAQHNQPCSLNHKWYHLKIASITSHIGIFCLLFDKCKIITLNLVPLRWSVMEMHHLCIRKWPHRSMRLYGEVCWKENNNNNAKKWKSHQSIHSATIFTFSMRTFLHKDHTQVATLPSSHYGEVWCKLFKS